MAVATERSEREPLEVSAKLAPLSLGFRVGFLSNLLYAPKKVFDTPGPDRVYVGFNPKPKGLHPSSVLHVPNTANPQSRHYLWT